MRTVTVYREIDGQVVKDEVSKGYTRRYEPYHSGLTLHERALNGYREAEEKGELRKMSAREKMRARDVHQTALECGGMLPPKGTTRLRF